MAVVTPHDFTQAGTVSLWATTKPVSGIHQDFLEGCDQLFMWLLVDFEVAINGAFATNFTRDGGVAPLVELLRDLHGSESFTTTALATGAARQIEQASFVVALYDCAYAPEALGLDADHRGSDFLAYVGNFSYEA